MKGRFIVLPLLIVGILFGISYNCLSQPPQQGTKLGEVVILSLYPEEQYIIVAYPDKDPEQKKNQVIVHVDCNTGVTWEDHIDPPHNVWQLTPGLHVQVTTNGVLTHSVPSQTLGLHIKILN